VLEIVEREANGSNGCTLVVFGEGNRSVDRRRVLVSMG
jgi:hypothetical protein